MGQATCRFRVRKGRSRSIDYGDRTLRITSEQVLCSRLPLPPGWGYKKGHLAGWGAHGENPVEASGFLLASLAVSLLSRGLALTIA